MEEGNCVEVKLLHLAKLLVVVWIITKMTLSALLKLKLSEHKTNIFVAENYRCSPAVNCQCQSCQVVSSIKQEAVSF